MKTQKIVEDNENYRAQNIPSRGGGTGFNQVLIQVQLMYTLQVCDYDEEKEKKEKQQKKRYATGFLPHSALCEGIPRKKGMCTQISTQQLLIKVAH